MVVFLGIMWTSAEGLTLRNRKEVDDSAKAASDLPLSFSSTCS